MVSPLHSQFTSGTQWFERTLDDSAIRRLSLPEAFLAADACLNLYLNVMERPAVYPKVIEKRVWSELPFMATENIIMAGVKRGGDRQELHEVIRTHSHLAGAQVKEHGKENDLLERLAGDPVVGMTLEEIMATLDVSKYIGRAPEQVDEFIAAEIDPILERHADLLGGRSEVRV
jgi:adenylosuccinate lyase